MRRVARVWAWMLLVAALFAPLLANDVPLVARVDGQLRVPALASYVGAAWEASGPRDDRVQTWREWWAELPATGGPGADWAVMPPWPYGPLMERDLANRNAGPSLAHPLGTDDVGRDLLSRMLWGASRALLVGAGAVIVAVAIGLPLGAVAGYAGGGFDAAVTLLIEVFLCFPALFLVLAIAAFMSSSLLAVVLVLGAVSWPSFARLVRGEFLSLREREFVLAARGLGVPGWRVVTRHMLPQVGGLLRAQAALLFAAAVVAEATLAFLGLGAGESWGAILARSREPAIDGAWHGWLFPSLAVASTVWCLHALAAPRPLVSLGATPTARPRPDR
ncbi:MAG: ABC transporter permease [Planctomycetota bacterium]